MVQQITREQFARLTNPVCSACDQPVAFDGIAVRHVDAVAGTVCRLLAAGEGRTLHADDTPETRAVRAELAG
jgi:hypothetical protein